MQTKVRNRKPGNLKSLLATAAFVVVAVVGTTLTSAGLLHVVAQSGAPTAQVASLINSAGTEFVR